jgi:hypothetical protein
MAPPLSDAPRLWPSASLQAMTGIRPLDEKTGVVSLFVSAAANPLC